MKKLICILLSVLLFTALLTVPATAASYVDFSLNTVSGNKGNTVKLTLSTANIVDISGFVFSFRYDTDRLAFKEGSVSTSINGIDGMSVYCKGDTVNVAWDSTQSVTFSSALLTIEFKVISDETVTTSVQFVVKELYSDYLSAANIPSRITSHGTVNIYGISAAVSNCVSLINSIGEVKDLSAKAAIDLAMNAYTALSTAEKMQVTNYSVLAAANSAYNGLLAQQDSLNTDNIIKEWKEAYNTVLSLTVSTVTLGDSTAVNQAISAWQSLPSSEAQAAMITEKNHLNKLKTQIEQLQKANEDAEKAAKEEATLKAEAKVIADEYKATYSWLLSLNIDEINEDYGEGIEKAISEYESIGYMNALAQDMLSEQKAILDKMNDCIELIKIEKDKENEPAIVAYYKFKKDFGWLLSMPVSSVTLDDVVDIKVAVFSYESLPAETQKMLTDEKQIIDNLLSAANSLSDEQSGSTGAIPEKEIVYQNVTEEASSAESETANTKAPVFVSSVIGKIGKPIWIAIILTAVQIVLLGMSAASYIIVKKRGTVSMEKAGEDIE